MNQDWWTLTNCCLCNEGNTPKNLDLEQIQARYKCKRCGDFGLNVLTEEDLSSGQRTNPLKPYLSCLSKQVSEFDGLELRVTGNWEAQVQHLQHTSVMDRVNKLLRYLAQKSRIPGVRVRIDPQFDYPIVDAETPQQFTFLFDYLREEGFVKAQQGAEVVLTMRGWTHLYPTSGGVPGNVFIAMWFDEEMQKIYQDGIRPAIAEDCRMNPIMLADLEHNDLIHDRMIADIRSAELVVCDITGERQNVYFEAGYAKALGRPVIWTSRRDAKPHFDVEQFNRILWDSATELRQKLAARIKAERRLTKG